MNSNYVDFDAKFFEYARKWVAEHPGLTEQQVEDSYNRIMEEWISRPADWLDGDCPGKYFQRYEAAEELVALMEGYAERGINLPEPLYARIVERGEACAPLLEGILRDEQRDEALRAEALGMLRDMDARCADGYLEALVCGAQERNELSDMAAEVLAGRDAATAARLLDAYPGAPDYAQGLILDVCCNFPGEERIYQNLVYKLKNDPEQRALWASCLNKLGDERAIGPLMEMLGLFDLKYLDYIELRDAVEALGGDAGEDRSFYGDPDFEALRNL